MHSKATLSLQLAQMEDVPAIRELMELSIDKLQIGYLTAEQIAGSHAVMGLDLQLISDGSYFCVFEDDVLIGCGGWSFRKTLYGGNHTQGRNPRRLDPKTERARIRAMYTHPDYTRRGVGRLILEASETAALKAGFREVEMAATLAGEPFYKKCGYHVESSWVDKSGEIGIPLKTMIKKMGD